MDTILAFRTTNRGTWRETFGGMADFAKSVGWQLQLVDARKAAPDFSALTAFWHPAGAIIDASGGTAFAKESDFGNLPAVAINPEDELASWRIPSVANDAGEIAKEAMGELLRLAPASLLFIGWFHDRAWCVERRRAARRIAAMHGVPMHVFSPEPGDAANPIGLVERLTRQIAHLPGPCGIFAVSDDIGRLALTATSRLGLDVPGDVAVVSVDDDPEVCENCTPTLTSVRPDYRRLGFAAASLLKAILEGGAAPAMTAVPLVGVMRRASTAATLRRDAKVAEALEYIRLHACDGLAASRVAKLFGTSLHTAEDRFRAATGRTIGQEILARRLSAACDHLREGRSSVAAIAEFCGWKGAPAFRKVFRTRFGVSPLRWAAAVRNGKEPGRRSASFHCSAR